GPSRLRARRFGVPRFAAAGAVGCPSRSPSRPAPGPCEAPFSAPPRPARRTLRRAASLSTLTISSVTHSLLVARGSRSPATLRAAGRERAAARLSAGRRGGWRPPPPPPRPGAPAPRPPPTPPPTHDPPAA